MSALVHPIMTPNDFLAWENEQSDRRHLRQDRLGNGHRLSFAGSGDRSAVAQHPGYDRSQKFALYRRVASLQEYVLIDPDTRRVESFRRGADDLWVLARHA